jgi:septum formation protein
VDRQQHALILASASPRRRSILSQLGIEFRVDPSGIDELRLNGESPAAHVQRLAAEKAREVCRRSADDPARPFVLAADTSVVVDDEVFGKPSDDADALRMLLCLSGRTHRVFTAMFLGQVGSAVEHALLLATEVTFRRLDEAALRRYVASGEARDKAGAYAIQGLGAGLVRAISGSYTNVVGMPAAETLELLERAAVLRSWP